MRDCSRGDEVEQPLVTKNSVPERSMVGQLVPLKGGIGGIFHPPEGKDYKWYISGIYWQLGDNMLPTTF